jgi:hypothetical protein
MSSVVPSPFRSRSVIPRAADPGRFRYSSWLNITIGVWSDQATEEAARRILELSKLMVKEHSFGHSSVVFVLDGAPAPTPAANQLFSRLYDDKVSDLKCMAIIVEGEGFWASSIRSAITGLRMSVPGAMQLRVSNHIDQVVEWLPAEHCRRTGVSISAPELRLVLESCRRLATD